ncbi:hypothetical protein EB796_021360 [Bugula neritina]|uniref:Uncharacterized protein n=1 Tax=Bugula neritina TaxID=10212 RepID=A0A7J7J2B6_BUGNE|nr:hypothetical protein EB796_021360 [Bugula neritina]
MHVFEWVSSYLPKSKTRQFSSARLYSTKSNSSNHTSPVFDGSNHARHLTTKPDDVTAKPDDMYLQNVNMPEIIGMISIERGSARHQKCRCRLYWVMLDHYFLTNQIMTHILELLP